MKNVHYALLFSGLLMFSAVAKAENEISLFNGDGEAVAYFSMEGREITVYLWDGTPAAYLDDGSIFGYNGKHLGWYVHGAIYDHDGYAACAIKDRINSTRLESLKSLKQLMPLKSLKELAPLQPLLQDRFNIPCEMLIKFGAG